ncbi:MAG: HAD family hydrolase [Lachnospiraceae bacterium]|nr:HAD family hydrolase [Lachnospiraceae bacterium]
MENLNSIKNIIFDIDGTLWDSRQKVAEAFNLVVKEDPRLVDAYPITKERLTREFGKPLSEIGKSLFPNLTDEENEEVIKALVERENAYLIDHCRTPYEGVPELFRTLAKTHKLYIVSNCQAGYIELFLANTGLTDCVTDHLCPGDTGLLKADSIRLIMERNHLEEAIYIGDTMGDYEAVCAVGIPFVHAAYGFGEVPEAIHRINRPLELLALLGMS